MCIELIGWDAEASAGEPHSRAAASALYDAAALTATASPCVVWAVLEAESGRWSVANPQSRLPWTEVLIRKSER